MTAANAELAGLRAADRRRGQDRRQNAGLAYDGADRRKSRGRRPTEARATVENLLEPPDSQTFLTTTVVLSRIGTEFAYLESDGELGRRHVAEMIKGIEAKVGGGEKAGHEERVRHLTEVQATAVYVRCGDNPGSETDYLSTIIIPGEPLMFGYDSRAHEQAARPLLQRFAKVLGYRIVEWESAECWPAR